MLKTFIYGSTLVSYSITGAGKPLVLLHGFGEDAHMWDEQAVFLQQYYSLIIPDLPGSGSSQLLTKENVSIDDYADCIHSLLKHEQISSCTMLGHSMGGYITLAFAEKYVSKLDAFGLIHSTAFADSQEKKKTREKGIAFIEEHGAHAFLKTSIPGLFGDRFKKEHPEKVDALIGAAAQFSKEALIQYYRAMIARADRTAVLKDNPLPVLFIAGTEDKAAPVNDVLEQTHLPLRSYIHILQGAGHMGMWEDAGAVNGFIRVFMEGR
jgi:pimeloyl-ACP methyl ester carboxylesterase